MLNKAISSIIGTLLMLIITIGLFGFSYSYISGVLTTKTAEVFSVVDAFSDTITISNDGTVPITSFSSVKIDGNDAVYRVSKQDNSLVGYWKMDEGSGSTTADSSGNANTGNLTNMNTTGNSTSGWNSTDCKFGNCMQFDNIDDKINISDSPSLSPTSAVTISAWVRGSAFQNAGSTEPVVSKYKGGTADRSYELNVDGVSGNQFFDFYLRAGSTLNLKSVTKPQNDIWYLVTATYDGSNMNMYVDGIFEANLANTGSITDSTLGVLIGWNHDNSFFGGLIDEVRIYNRALSADEIKAIYNIGSQINPGEIAAIKVYNQLSKGTHTLRICTSSTCNTAVLRIN
ncbi:MAG: hypothetical protein HY361_04475 [Candidatus Aenigmarchaeota archaeon]|nr:hypothetical protein [Candidatus Aenigmarchaeota archaeon]